MIKTITLNPALDKTLTVEDLQIDEVNRVKKSRTDIGGKGINVSKVLKNFGLQSEAGGFLGSNLKKHFEQVLDTTGIDHAFIEIRKDTRTNIKIVDRKKNTFTDLNEPGGAVDQNEIEEFLAVYKEKLHSGDVVVLSGGVSEGVERSIYKRLTQAAKDLGAWVIVDAEGDLLQEAIQAKPHCIKPNIKELEMLLGQSLDTEEKIVKAARQFIDQGIEQVLVSRGADGSIYVTRDHTYKAGGIKVEVLSTVGAGDSMVAALVYSHVKGLSDFDTLVFSQCAGTAAVMLEGSKACTLAQVEELKGKAREKISKIK
ncbi:MAG TPA: 1-phosphofructokinase [Eubacteriaceae bacterium]|nr:1-phosphofructokinase [Eubacteriaceae bacterium]